jgi:hypothetical protein|tara:strand:- start:99 stop:344 length:246 start_codon:yes stop_codon:yes gene_type:complete
LRPCRRVLVAGLDVAEQMSESNIGPLEAQVRVILVRPDVVAALGLRIPPVAVAVRYPICDRLVYEQAAPITVRFFCVNLFE